MAAIVNVVYSFNDYNPFPMKLQRVFNDFARVTLLADHILQDSPFPYDHVSLSPDVLANVCKVAFI